MSTPAAELIRGAIDMHCHHGPDPHRRRSVDAEEAVREADAIGMRGLVLKSHAYCDFEVGGLNCMPGGFAATHAPATFARAIAAVGPARAIMSTDFGQDRSPHPAAGMRMFIDEMLRAGLSAVDVDLMARRNPARLLGLE